MENLQIEATKYTPEVNFDINENIIRLAGKSTPENTFEFFEPITKWLKEYFEQPRECVVTFHIPYFNSSSSRAIYDIFDILSDAHDAGSKIVINWEYNENNENGEETGEEFKEDFEDMNINLVINNS